MIIECKAKPAKLEKGMVVKSWDGGYHTIVLLEKHQRYYERKDMESWRVEVHRPGETIHIMNYQVTTPQHPLYNKPE